MALIVDTDLFVMVMFLMYATQVMSSYERRYTYCEHNMHATIFRFLEVSPAAFVPYLSSTWLCYQAVSCICLSPRSLADGCPRCVLVEALGGACRGGHCSGTLIESWRPCR